MPSTAYTTYYSLSGVSYDFRYYWDTETDTMTSFDASVSLDVSAEPGAGFTYKILTVDLADGTIWVDINPSSDTHTINLDGMNAYTSNIDSNIIGVNWTLGGAAHSSVLMELEVVKGENADKGYEYGTRYYFVLDGDALPDFSTLSDFRNFSETDKYITGVYKVAGDFGPGTLIPWADMESTTVLGADEDFTGTAGNDSFNGGYGDDYFLSSEGNDTYKGGAGTFDQVSFVDDPAGVMANLATGEATDGWGDADTLSGIEVLRGSAFDDTLIGKSGRDVFRGVGGNDIINGAKGRDEVRYDRDERYGGSDGVTVNLKKGTATDGFGDTDTLHKIEDVRGTEVKDKIIGSKANNALDGLGGDDVLKGLGGKDTLDGGNGRDTLLGGGGPIR